MKKKHNTYVGNIFYRYDLFIIWANGLKYKKQIIADIETHGYFEIVLAQEIEIGSIKRFINHVYNFDYAPKIHLISKTKYLKSLDHRAMYVLVRNNNPDEYFEGKGKFQHIESRTVKQFKERLRNKYNDYIDGKRTENHIVHATDNEQQVDGILRYIRKKNGLAEFQTSQILRVPFHLGNIDEFEVEYILFKNMYARILNDKGMDLVSLEETPQYKYLVKQTDDYKKYLSKYQYSRLSKTFHVDKLAKLYESITYESYLKYGNYIIIREMGKDKKFVIADGVHRSVAMYAKGYEGAVVVKETSKWI